MSGYVIHFESRSDDGPRMVGPFPQRAGAEGHLTDLARPGFTAVSEIVELSRVIESMRAVKRRPPTSTGEAKGEDDNG